MELNADLVLTPDDGKQMAVNTGRQEFCTRWSGVNFEEEQVAEMFRNWWADISADMEVGLKSLQSSAPGPAARY